MTVLVGDDDEALRAALIDTLAAAADISVIGDAGDAGAVVRLACQHKPDVVLLDVRMPGGGGRHAASQIVECHPEARIVALSAYEDHSAVLEMIGAGAVAYLVKGSPEDEIVEAIRRAARGQFSLSAELARTLIGELVRENAERRQSETAVRKSEERFRALVQAAPDAMVMTDSVGAIELINARVEELFGYGEADLLGQPIERLLPERFRESHVKQRSAYSSNPRHRPLGSGLQLFGRRRDGTEFPVDISLSPVETAAGPKTVAAIRNVTERWAAETLRQRSEERFRGLLESAPDGMVIVDRDGVIQLVNAQTERLFGYPRSELVGKSVDELLPARLRGMHSLHRARYAAEPLTRPMGAGLELLGRRKDASEFPVDISLSPLETDEGVLVVAAVRDVTDRKLAERELARSSELAERQRLFAHLVRLQEEERLKIASDIHDDTIQAMTAASLRLQQLRRHLTQPRDLELLAKLEAAVYESIVRLRRLMFDLRPPALDRSGLAAALRDLLEQLHEEAGIEASLDGDLSIEVPSEVRTAIYRIAQEAIVNVRKHAQASHVSVELAAIESGCRVRITDDGVGFEPQAQRPGHLGLVAMQERARMAGGWWKVDRLPAGGTTVEFWIPLQPKTDPLGGPFSVG